MILSDSNKYKETDFTGKSNKELKHAARAGQEYGDPRRLF